MQKISEKLVAGISLALIGCIVFYIMHIYPIYKTKNIITLAIKERIYSNEAYTTHLDAWHEKIEISVDKQDSGTIYSGRSAGKDLTFGTDDDILVHEVDWNKSRMIGKYLTTRMLEAVKGVGDTFKK